MVECWGWVQESHSLLNEVALLCGGKGVDASVSFLRRQQGEQTEAWVGVGSAQTSPCQLVMFPVRWIFIVDKN